MVILNRAVTLSQTGKIIEAISEILALEDIETLLQTQYMYSAVLGDMYLTLTDYTNAQKYLTLSLQLTSSDAEKKLLRDKLKMIPV